MSKKVSLLCAALAALCSAGNCQTTAASNGSVNGVSLTARDTVSAQSSASSGGTTTASLLVAIADVSGICATLQANKNRSNATALILSVTVSGSATTVPPATYNIGTTTTSSAGAIFSHTDANCFTTLSAANSGTIVVNTANQNGASGTCDLTFGPRDHLSGSFISQTCNFTFTAGQTTGCQ